MYIQIFVFVLLALAFLNVSRLGLVIWQFARAQQHPMGPIFLGGLRIDLSLLAMLVAPSFLLAPWFEGSAMAWGINAVWLTLMWVLLVLPEVSSAQFIYEYDTRPNRLFTDYLKHPQEVMGMLWKGYKLTVFAGLLVLLASTYGVFVVLQGVAQDWLTVAWWAEALFFVAGIVILFGLIRGTLKHRPINPSTVAYCGDSMLNTLSLNSLYSVLYALYSIKNERSAADNYGKMDTQDVFAIVNREAQIEPEDNVLSIPSWHSQKPLQVRQRPKNIVLIVQESLGAQYIGTLGGQALSPEFDQLAQEGWCFERCYATGTRSVRGLEAVSSGFPPTVSDAVLRLSKSQSRFFTLAQLLKDYGYRSSFIYGGEAHFDNMKSFFLGNGFDELYEQKDFKNPAFVGTWGASDEDMFNTLHEVLSQDLDVPKLSLAFTVTNHTPWEYPEGRIQPIGEPASVENSVRYVDWCIGQFFAKAKQSAYWQDTLFLIVADHDSRVWGDTLVPLQHFHIPALILGEGVPIKRESSIISQIDLPVTLLSLAGIEAAHPMIGRDLTQAQGQKAGRAMMQYNDNYGYLQGDILTVLCPAKSAQQFTYQMPAHYQAIPEAEVRQDLIEIARAHAIWPNLMYATGSYTQPSLHKID